MARNDDRTRETHSIPMEGVIHRGTGPRKAPPKVWPSNKPPGGKLPSREPDPTSSLDRASATPSEVVMSSKDGYTSRLRDVVGPGAVVHRGTGPREAPPKKWPSNKPPGGKRLEPPTTTDKQS